jgi:hypothetical protein
MPPVCHWLSQCHPLITAHRPLPTYMPFFETITDLLAGAETLKRRAYGVIEMVDGRFDRIYLRPFPKIISAPEIVLFGNRYHRRAQGDRLWLYYNQPRRYPNFLALKYIVSTRHASMKSLTRALEALDYIAQLKHSDALLCDVGNWRISTKLLSRWNWEPHCSSRWHRHYIKRFYGDYPPRAQWIETEQNKNGVTTSNQLSPQLLKTAH